MKYTVLLILTFFLFSCREKVNVKENDVLLTVVNKKAGQLLRSGQHVVPKGTKGVYYSIAEEKLSFDFDFLFKDNTLGHVKFDLMFRPKVDSLTHFFNEYKSDAFSVVVDVTMRMEIRNLLERHNRNDFLPEEIQRLITTRIQNQEGVLRYVELKGFSPVIVRL